MRGRIESQLKLEKKIEEKIDRERPMLRPYYYSIAFMSHTTKERYIDKLIFFLDYCEKKYGYSLRDEKDCGQITTDNLNEFINSYSKKSDGTGYLAPGTVCFMIAILTSFFNYLCNDTRLFDVNPTARMGKRPKIPKKTEIIALEPEEVQQLFYNIDHTEGDFINSTIRRKWKSRDRAFFSILLVTGVRETALFEANMEDLFMEERYIVLTDKGNKTRRYDFDDDMADIIGRWLRRRERLLEGKPCDYLFFNLRKGLPIRLTDVTMNQILKDYTGFTDKVITCHKLRSTGGTMVYRTTHDIYKVADFLNHSNVSTSQIYAQQDSDNRKKASSLMSGIITGKQ